MANVKTSTFTTSDGTKVSITVNGDEFIIEGRRPDKPVFQPVDSWQLQHEISGLKLMIVGWGMATIVALVLIALFCFS